MSYPIPVHLPNDVFHALTACTGEHWFGDMSSAALCDAVRSWIAREDAGTAAAPPSIHGYQWKQLFLPEGTNMRTTFQGQVAYAAVLGDAIIADGTRVSPSQFVNAHGCGNRNAWRALWLRFPGEARWRLAAHCRDAAREMEP
ncbi:MAG TPA: hypothetical protein VJ752_11950 [Burkholderiaceae bacterium]|nr:hypothetical protein [Burkholderiaceae bacterium]